MEAVESRESREWEAERGCDLGHGSLVAYVRLGDRNRYAPVTRVSRLLTPA